MKAIWLTLVALTCGGCGLLSGGVVKGTVTAQATQIGSFQATMGKCSSGARGYFLGVDTASVDKQTFVRVTVDATQGPILLLLTSRVPGSAARMSRENCSVLDVQVQPNGIQVNGVDVMAGHATFDCTLKTGGTVQGQIVFDNCS